MDTYNRQTGALQLNNGHIVQLSNFQQRIVDHLLLIRPNSATTDDLLQSVYQDRDGPSDEHNTMHVHMWHIGKKLHDSTMRIRHQKYSHYWGIEGEVNIVPRRRPSACPCCGQKVPDDG